MTGVTQFAGRVGPQGRIETKNCTGWQPNLVSIRPSAYSTDGLALNPVTPGNERTGFNSMGGEAIFVKKLMDIAHLRKCQELQRQVWGMEDIAVVPLHLLVTAQKNGGLVLGAFDERGEMIGFLFGFLGITAAGQLKHCSHMVGILPEYRNRGIGYGLKLKQREHVLEQGIDLVTWTYDPLEGVNAYLNFDKLGVICRIYLSDVYGEMPTELHAGLSTDRFEVEWWIRSRHVKERLQLRREKLTLAEALDTGSHLVNHTEFDERGILRSTTYDLKPSAETLLVEIPADFQALKKADMALAREWRRQTQEIFETCFHAGYTVTDFISQVRGEQRYSFYVLRRDFQIT